jgi:polyphosphate kinase 2 (PPK2 family)
LNNKEMKKLIKTARKLAKPFRVTDDRFRLKDIDPGDTLRFMSEDKPRAKEALAMGVDLLAELQDMLYAQDRWAVLLMFQAMDAAGKDGAITADNKWFTRVVVAAAVIDALADLNLHYPKVSEEKLKELAAAKRALQAGK